MDYKIVIERSPRNYSAFVPTLPGCVATGKTLKQLKRRIRVAIAWHITGLLEDGDVVPSPQP
jgi:predicted RNase H-like HicB family nuclease